AVSREHEALGGESLRCRRRRDAGALKAAPFTQENPEKIALSPTWHFCFVSLAWHSVPPLTTEVERFPPRSEVALSSASGARGGICASATRDLSLVGELA